MPERDPTDKWLGTWKGFFIYSLLVKQKVKKEESIICFGWASYNITEVQVSNLHVSKIHISFSEKVHEF